MYYELSQDQERDSMIPNYKWKTLRYNQQMSQTWNLNIHLLDYAMDSIRFLLKIREQKTVKPMVQHKTNLWSYPWWEMTKDSKNGEYVASLQGHSTVTLSLKWSFYGHHWPNGTTFLLWGTCWLFSSSFPRCLSVCCFQWYELMHGYS